MTTNESFDRRLSAWLDDEEQGRVPDHLAEVLVRTKATPQRRTWPSVERWLPMPTFRGRSVPVAVLLGLLLMIVLALAAIGFVGNRPRAVVALPTTGPTRAPARTPGELTFVDGSLVRVANGDGSGLRTIYDFGGPPAIALSWSADGSVLAAEDDLGKAVLLRPDGTVFSESDAWGTPLVPDDGPIGVSPDGARVVYVGADVVYPDVTPPGGSPRQIQSLNVVIPVDLKTSGGGFAGGPPGVTYVHPTWSPDGRWVAYLADAGPGFDAYVVPVGDIGTVRVSQARLVASLGTDPAFGGPIWAPDPALDRLAVVSGGNGDSSVVTVIDLNAAGDPSKTTPVAAGFWPSWSMDGSTLAWLGGGSINSVNVPGLVTGDGRIRTLDAQMSGDCGQNTDLAGKAICATAAWSPDGMAIAGPDVTGRSLVILSVDGATAPVVIPYTTARSADAPTLAVAAWRPGTH